MSAKSKYDAVKGGSSSSTYGIRDTSSQGFPSKSSASSEQKIALTEGGSSALPFLPTIRKATSGAVREVLSDMDIATKDDINDVNQRLDHLEEKVDRIDDGMGNLATREDIRTMLEGVIDD